MTSGHEGERETRGTETCLQRPEPTPTSNSIAAKRRRNSAQGERSGTLGQRPVYASPGGAQETFSQTLARVRVHVVFSTKDRMPSLKEEVRPSMFVYMGGTVRRLGGEAVIVNGVSDHVHILLTLPATLALADAMRALKAKSSGWLRRTSPSFAWQLGYAAFSVSESNAGHVKRRA